MSKLPVDIKRVIVGSGTNDIVELALRADRVIADDIDATSRKISN